MAVRRFHAVSWCLVGAAVLNAVVSSRLSLQSAGPQDEWRAYGAALASTHYSAADQITRQNVGNLKVAWRQSLTPDAVKQGRTVPPPPITNQTTPLMIGGLVYYSTGNGMVVALDAATGKVVWYDPVLPAAAPAGAARDAGAEDGAPAGGERAASPTGATGRDAADHRARRRPQPRRAQRENRESDMRSSATVARSISARDRSAASRRSPGGPGQASSCATSS